MDLGSKLAKEGWANPVVFMSGSRYMPQMTCPRPSPPSPKKSKQKEKKQKKRQSYKKEEKEKSGSSYKLGGLGGDWFWNKSPVKEKRKKDMFLCNLWLRKLKRTSHCISEVIHFIMRQSAN